MNQASDSVVNGPQNPAERAFLMSAALLFLLAMHLSIEHGGGIGLSMPYNALSWIPVSLMICIGLVQIINSKTLRYSRFGLSLALAVVLLTLPYAYSDPDIAWHTIDRHLGLVCALLFFFALMQFSASNNVKRWLYFAIIGGVAIEAAWMVAEWVARCTSPPTASPRQIVGVFRQKNLSASLLSTGIALSLCYSTGAIQGIFRCPVNKHCTLACNIIAITCIALLFCIPSWSGRIGGSMAILFLIAHLSLTGRLKEKAKKIISILVIGVGLGLTMAALIPAPLEKPHQQNQPKPETLSERTERKTNVRGIIYALSFKMFQDHWKTGVGYGGFSAAYVPYRVEHHRNNPGDFEAREGNLDHPHNEVLLWGVEGGVIALLAILIPAVYLVKIALGPGWKMALAWLALISPLIVHALLEMPLRQSVPHLIIFMTLLFMIDTATQPTKEQRLTLPRILKLPFYITPVFVTLFMLAQLHTIAILTKIEKDPSAENYQLLNSVINPFGSLLDLQFAAMTYQIAGSIRNDKQAGIKNYLGWAEEFAQHSPSAELTASRTMGLIAISQMQRAASLARWGRLAYPQDRVIECLLNFIEDENPLPPKMAVACWQAKKFGRTDVKPLDSVGTL